MSHSNFFSRITWEIFHGEDARGPWSKLHAAEDGMLSFLTVVAVLFFVLLTGFVANIAYVTREKVEVQNAADAVAYSGALWQARGMNAVTAANHLQGELTAICVLHYAMGGAELDKGQTFTTNEIKSMRIKLWQAYAFAHLSPNFWNFLMEPEDVINYDHKAGATLYDSRLTLQYWLWWSFFMNGVAGILDDLLDDAGLPIDIAASALREKVYQEWKTLDALEQSAQTLTPVRKQLEATVIPLVSRFADSVIRQTPLAIDKAVKQIGEQNRVEAAIHPPARLIRLPVEPESKPVQGRGGLPLTSAAPHGTAGDVIEKFEGFVRGAQSALDDFTSSLGPFSFLVDLVIPLPPRAPGEEYYAGNPTLKSLPGVGSKKPGDRRANWDKEKQSQFARATYPWVNAWRSPVRSAMEFPLLTLSRASQYYHHWTNRVTLSKCWELRDHGNGPPHMYVMRHANADGRGKERWTKAAGSLQADQLFTVVAVVHRPYHTLASPTVHGSANTDGLLAYAQAMVYNANDQKPGGKVSPGGFQPELGWNTLNWKSPINQSDAHEYPHGARIDGGLGDVVNLLRSPNAVPHPIVHLNWQAKLTPVTRLRELTLSPVLPENHRRVLRKLVHYPELNTH
jgi:hypothetical protein